MIASSLVFTMLLNFFVTGCLCSVLIRHHKLAEITRPIAQASLVFALGHWWMYRDSLLAMNVDSFAVSLVPWLILSHLALTLLMKREIHGKYSLHPGVILFSALSLCGMCVSNQLGFLVLFGEFLAVSLWLISPKTQRRVQIFRTLVTSGLIGVGTLFILSETQIDLFAPVPEAITGSQSENALYESNNITLGLRSRMGLLCFVLGVAWRMGFFPFHDRHAKLNTGYGFQSLFSTLSWGVLSIVIFLPRLEGGAQLGQMLMLTFAVPTLIRETLRSGWRDSLLERIECWFFASAALMWLGVGQELFLIDRGEALGLWLPMGREMVRLEFLSSLAGFAFSYGILREISHSEMPCQTREDLSGLMWTHPLPSLLLIVTLLSWMGLPGLVGFESRFGLLAGAFEIAGLGLDVSGGYSLIGVVIAICQMLLFLLVLLTLQSLCESQVWHRHTRYKLTWRLCLFALLLIGFSLSL